MSRKTLLFIFIFYDVLSGGYVTAQKTDSKSEQQKPNFSGSWVLNQKKSYEIMPSALSTSKTCTFTLKITHQEPQITIVIERKCQGEDNKIIDSGTYFTDRRGEINKDIFGEDRSSKTTWNGDKIVIISDANQPKSAVKYDVDNLRIISVKNNKLTEKQDIRTRTEFNVHSASGGYYTTNLATFVYDLKP